MTTHAEQAQLILDRIEESNQPNPDATAFAQVHAILAVAEELREANKIAIAIAKQESI